jgi:hypothetical protein
MLACVQGKPTSQCQKSGHRIFETAVKLTETVNLKSALRHLSAVGRGSFHRVCPPCPRPSATLSALSGANVCWFYRFFVAGSSQRGRLVSMSYSLAGLFPASLTTA